MENNSKNTNKKDTIRAATILETEEILRGTDCEVSQRQIQRVLAGEQNNEKVVAVFMEVKERKSMLIEEVRKLIPFI